MTGLRGRAVGFTAAPLVAGLAPFLILPILARVTSAAEWTAVATGQALGAIAAVGVGLGWTLVGPPRLSYGGARKAEQLWWDSVLTRIAALALIAVILVPVSFVLAYPSTWSINYLAAVGVAATGLSCSWHAVGRGRGSDVVWFDAVPKVSGVALGAVILLTIRDVPFYLAVVLLGALVGPAWYGARHYPRIPRRRFRSVIRLAAVQRQALGANLLSSVQNAAPVIVVGALSAALPAGRVVSADKLYRAGQIATQALVNTVQAWALHGRPTSLTPRLRGALGAHLLLGIVGCGLLISLGPWVTGFAFGADLAAPIAACVGYGLAYLLFTMNIAVSRLVLVPRRGGQSIVLASAAAGVGVGLTAMIALVMAVGAEGVPFGLAIAEMTVAIGYSIGLSARLTRRAGDRDRP